MKSIYIVILNYNNYCDTKECIDGLLKHQSNENYNEKIILVDNHSKDGSGDRLYNDFKNNIIFIKNSVNYGYAAGNNVGIKYAIDHNADFLCVLNNDTLANEDFITPCLRYLEENSDVAFVSPTIENYNNNFVQSTGGDIFFEKGCVTVKNNGSERDNLPQTVESDYLGGACLIFKSELINAIGLIPENYFLFFEETEWCWKAKKQGLHNICITTTYIKHKGSASIDTINGLHAYLMERNRVVFLRRNAPSNFIYMRAIIFLTIKYIKKGIFENKNYFKYLKYMSDGKKNIVDSKYPFVHIENLKT